MAEETSATQNKYLHDLLSLWNLNGVMGNTELLDAGIVFNSATEVLSTESDVVHQNPSCYESSLRNSPQKYDSPQNSARCDIIGGRPQRCSACNTSNESGCNWCSECGTVLSSGESTNSTAPVSILKRYLHVDLVKNGSTSEVNKMCLNEDEAVPLTSHSNVTCASDAASFENHNPSKVANEPVEKQCVPCNDDIFEEEVQCHASTPLIWSESVDIPSKVHVHESGGDNLITKKDNLRHPPSQEMHTSTHNRSTCEFPYKDYADSAVLLPVDTCVFEDKSYFDSFNSAVHLSKPSKKHDTGCVQETHATYTHAKNERGTVNVTNKSHHPSRVEQSKEFTSSGKPKAMPGFTHPSRHWTTSGMYMWRKPSSFHRQIDSGALSHTTRVTSSLSMNRPISEIHSVLTNKLNGNESDKGRFICEDKPTVRDTGFGVDSCKVEKLYPTPVSTKDRSSSDNIASIPVPCLALPTPDSQTATSKDTPRCIGIMYLPDELLLEILSNLSQADRFACMCVCKRFYYIALDHSLWNYVKITNSVDFKEEYLSRIALKQPTKIMFYRCKGNIASNDFHQFFQKTTATLKVLRLSLCDFGPMTGDMVLTSAATHCPNLSSISVDWTVLSKEALVNCFEKCIRLEEFCINQSHHISRSVLRVLFKQHGRWLKCLDVGNSLAEDVFSVCSKEKATSMFSFAATFRKVEPRILRQLSSTFPNLKHLYIRHLSSTNFPLESAMELSKLPLASLSFKLSSGGSVLGRDACSYISEMSSLRHFAANCINDDALCSLCQGRLRLHSLDLSDSAVTLKSFQVIGACSFSETLVKLKMNHCKAINQRSTLCMQGRGGNILAQELRQLKAKCLSLRMILIE